MRVDNTFVRALVASALLSLVVATDVARAQPTDAAQSEAKALLVEGSNLYKRERYDEALDKLERSNRLVPSPNSALMIARCLVRLERPVEAYERFQQAERQASELVEKQPRYKRTHESARSEGEAVRATLGAVRVRVPNAPEGTAVELQGRRRPLDDKDEASLLGTPGSAEITVRLPNAQTLSRTVELEAGGEVSTTVELQKPKPKPRPEPEESATPWQLPAAIALGGLGVVSLGLFIGFGVHNQSIYDRLEEECAPACGPERAEEIEEGETAGIVANVTLAVGLAALAAGGTFLVLYLTDDSAKDSAALAIGAGGVSLQGSFGAL
jgi:hypothetical protein